MSAAEQGSDRDTKTGASAAPAVGQTGVSCNLSDLSFERLLAQLEAEGDQPAAGRDVSQIFAPSQAEVGHGPAGGHDPTHPEVHPQIHPDASAFAPAATGAFAAYGQDTSASIGNAPDQNTAVASTASEPAAPLAAAPGQSGQHGEAEDPDQRVVAKTSATPLTPVQESAGEFTRIFTQLPTPRSAPPAILAEVLAAPPALAPQPGPGEFTQFFRAIESSQGSSTSAGPPAGSPTLAANSSGLAAADAASVAGAGSPIPGLAAPGPAPASSAPNLATSSSGQDATTESSAKPATSVSAAFSTPPAATQTFEPTPQPFNPASFAPATPAPPHATGRPTESASELGQPGAFTAFFQAANAGPAVSAGAEASQARAAVPLSSQASRQVPKPAFPTAFADPPPSRPAGGGGFTELLQSLGSASGAASGAASHFSPGPVAPASQPHPDAFPPTASPAPQAFAPRPGATPQSNRQATGGAARPGEFTELMQSLQSPQSRASTPAAMPASPAPFFGGAQQISSAGPSEFTRVMQGSAARSAEAPLAGFAPAPQASGAAVGLPIAAPQAPKSPALHTAEAKTKLQAMMPLLLAANGALLLLLIALAYMFLRHRQ